MAVGIQVEDIKVRSLDVDFNEVTWTLAPTAEDVWDYTFTVLRSESPMGPFDDLTPTLEDQFIFVDNGIERGHAYRQYHYKVRVTHKESEEYKDFGPASMAPEVDLEGRELRKHVALLMREFAGRRCWVLPVRTTGSRCGCYDVYLQKRTRSGCLTCYDTGFVRGYLHPIEAFVQIDPNPKAEQEANVAKQQQKNTTGKMPYFPPLKPNALIIEAENKRWRVVNVSSTQKGRAIVHQEFQVHLIPDMDIEYRIELQMDHALKDLFINPPRNFTNPHTLEAYQEETFESIYGLYAHILR